MTTGDRIPPTRAGPSHQCYTVATNAGFALTLPYQRRIILSVKFFVEKMRVVYGYGSFRWYFCRRFGAGRLCDRAAGNLAPDTKNIAACRRHDSTSCLFWPRQQCANDRYETENHQLRPTRSRRRRHPRPRAGARMRFLRVRTTARRRRELSPWRRPLH